MIGTRPGKPLSRRTVLRGAGVSLALPLLEAMAANGSSQAFAASRAKKFIAVTSPNGVVPAAFWPKGNELAFPAGGMLEPLRPHQEDLLLLKGLKNQAALDTNVPASHPEGNFTLLTGSAPTGVMGQNFAAWRASRASIDQVLAATDVNKATPFPVLNIGADGIDWSGAIAFDGALQLLPNVTDPKTLFKRLFIDASATQAELARLREHRHSVLDGTLASCKRLVARLGGQDKLRVQAHCEEVRALERRLAVPSSCGEPPADLGVTSYGHIATKYEELPRILDEFSRLLVLALSCGLTNVSTFVLKRGGGGSYYASFLGQAFDNSNGIHEIHEMSHHVGQPEWDPKLVLIGRFFMQQVATLVSRLKDVVQPDGSRLFDDVVLMHGSEVAEGNHGKTNMPLFLLGNAQGAWKTGRMSTYEMLPHNKLLVAVLEAFNVSGASRYDHPTSPGPLAL